MSRKESDRGAPRTQFTAFSRLLHWTMAAMIWTMLGIGLSMVVSLAYYHVLISIHRPLGIAILVLVVVRFVNRQFSSLPPLPATMSRLECFAATAAELVMYGLMFILPLVGWGMLSAGAIPSCFSGPCICLISCRTIWPCTRCCGRRHTILAYLFLLTIFAHIAAVLFHTLIVRDGMFQRMAPWTICAAACFASNNQARPRC